MADFVKIASFNSLQDAYLAKAYLEAEEIEVFLQDEFMAEVLFNANGGIKMLAHETEKDKAVELLKEGGFL